jgi:hypothetical protein
MWRLGGDRMRRQEVYKPPNLLEEKKYQQQQLSATITTSYFNHQTKQTNKQSKSIIMQLTKTLLLAVLGLGYAYFPLNNALA